MSRKLATLATFEVRIVVPVNSNIAKLQMQLINAIAVADIAKGTENAIVVKLKEKVTKYA